MIDKPENPLAFPFRNPAYDGNWDKDYGSCGMTLRDYFAAAALQGLLASPTSPELDDCAGKSFHQYFSENAYDYADRMLEARQS